MLRCFKSYASMFSAVPFPHVVLIEYPTTFAIDLKKFLKIMNTKR